MKPSKSDSFAESPTGIFRHPIAQRVVRVLLYAATSALLVLLALFGLTLQTEPILGLEPRPAHAYLSRTRTLIHNTVRTEANGINQRILELASEDLTAAANFALLRKKLEGQAECSLAGNRLTLTASIRLPIRWIRLFLNVRMIADNAEPQVIIKRVRLGRLSIPAPIIGWLVHGAIRYTPLLRYSLVGDQLIRKIHVQDDHLVVALNWNRDVLAQAQGLVTDLADKERLLIYHDKLAEAVGQPQLKRFVRLAPLIQSLFTLAKTRSENDNDPVAENRALILVLSTYVNGKTIEPWLPATGNRPSLTHRSVLLNRRIDTAQHFMGSAALAMSGHSTLVDMIGLAKEMNDTHHGSGFSFIDLAADEAGAMFGKTAVRSEEKARRTQDILSRSADDALFMPVVKDLPENLSPADFTARFKDIHSPEFQAMKAQIQDRIRALGLYQPP